MISITIKAALLSSVLLVAANAQSENKGAVGVLKSRQHIVEMYAGEHEPLYTVKDIQGETVAILLTGSELLSQIPELESVIYGYADDASLGGKTYNPIDILKESEF